MKRFFIILTCVLFFFTACTSMGTIITEDSHTVVIDSSVSGGKLSVSSSTFQVGDTVAVTVTPNEGMKLKDGSLMYKFGNDSIPIRRNSFFMPSGQVQLTAEFIPENNTEIILKTLPRDSVIFMGSVTLDFQIKSRVDDISVEWHLENPDMAEIIPMDEYGTRIALKQLQHGSTNLVGHSGDGAQKVVEITILDNILTYQNNGVITGPTPKFHGGELIIPDFLDSVPVTGIKEKAFADRGVTAVRLPESLVYIEAEAFAGNNIVSVEIPSSVEAVGFDAFSNCGLTTIYCSSAMADKIWLGTNAFGESVGQIIVTDGILSPFRTTVTWSEYLGFITGMDSKAIVTRQLAGGSLTFKCDGIETSYAVSEEIVNINIVPDAGWQYISGSVGVKDERGSSIEVRTSDDGLLYFTMPDSTVSVSAEFEKVNLSYSVQHRGPVEENSNIKDYGEAGTWGNVSMKLADDLSKLTITPIPNPGYKLVAVSVVNSETFHNYTNIETAGNLFHVHLEQGTFTANSGLGIIAIWDSVIVNVLFKDAGGEKTVHTTKVRYAGDLKNATFPTIPTKEGYEFSGYYTAPNGGGECFIDNEMKAVITKFTPGTYSSETNSVNLYPGFTPKTYTVTLLLGAPKDIVSPKAQTVVHQITVTYGAPLPSAISDFKNYKDEYPLSELAGFYGHGKMYFDRSGVTLISNWDIPANTVLEGVWNPKKITMKFNYNGSPNNEDTSDREPEILNSFSATAVPGQSAPTVIVTHRKDGKIVSYAPHRLGYIFCGLYDNPECTGDAFYDKDLKPVSSSLVAYGSNEINLYAKWEPRNLNYTFDFGPINDGTYKEVYPDENLKINTTVSYTTPGLKEQKEYFINGEAPTRKMFTFKGFYDKPDGKGRQFYTEELEPLDVQVPPTDEEEVVLYAHWNFEGTKIKSGMVSGQTLKSGNYGFFENVTVRAVNGNDGVIIDGTPEDPTNFYIATGVTVKFVGGDSPSPHNAHQFYDGKYDGEPVRVSKVDNGSAPGLSFYMAYSREDGSHVKTELPKLEVQLGRTVTRQGDFIGYKPANDDPKYISDLFAMVPEYSTWTEYIKDAATYSRAGNKGGHPGIYLPEGKKLVVYGTGVLQAKGGKGQNAYPGLASPHMNAGKMNDNDHDAHEEEETIGGIGGIGAGGGGAAIGTRGGTAVGFYDTSTIMDHNNNDYWPDQHVVPPVEKAGYLEIYGSVTTQVQPGKGGSRGSGGSGGTGKDITAHDDHAGAGGGGGGGAGGYGAGYGSGGGAGGNGRGGHNGFWWISHKIGEHGSKEDGDDGHAGASTSSTPKLYYAIEGGKGGDGGDGGGFDTDYDELEGLVPPNQLRLVGPTYSLSTLTGQSYTGSADSVVKSKTASLSLSNSL